MKRIRGSKNAGLIWSVYLEMAICVLIGFIFAARPVTASGQNTPASSVQSDFQSWDELDVSAKLAKNLDASWISQGRISTEFPNPATYLTGADLNISAGIHLVLTPSYYYLALVTTTGEHRHYQVPMLAATIRTTAGKWTVSDRNRFMGAIGDGNNFWLYLNRPKVEYRLGSLVPKTSVFIWDEVFYFSVFQGWTRNRLGTGVRTTLSEQWAAQFYYLRQDDLKSQPREINSVGLTLELRIR